MVKQMNEEIYEFYKSNPEFKKYVDSYCRSRQVGIFEALRHKTIREVAKYYDARVKEKL